MADESTGTKTVFVLFPTGVRKAYPLTERSTVRSIVSLIKADDEIEKPPNRRVTLVYHGRILHSREVIYNMDELDEFTVHAFFRAKRMRQGNPEPVASEPVRPVDSLSDDLYGFDRLRRLNYTPAQIAAIRESFHGVHGTTDFPEDERMAAEDEWFPAIFDMADQGPFALANPTPIRHDDVMVINDIETFVFDPSLWWLRTMIGAVIGTAFGLGGVFFLLMSGDDVYFPFGIMIGIFSHYMLRFLLAE